MNTRGRLVLGRAAGEDLQIDGQLHLASDFTEDAQDVASNVFHLIGGQAVVNKLADINVSDHSTKAQVGGILPAAIPAVGIVQRFEEIPEVVVDLETYEDRLVNQEFEQFTPSPWESSFRLWDLRRLRQPDIASPRAFDIRLAVEGDLLSFAEGIEPDRLTLASMEEYLFSIGRGDEAEPTICQLLDLSRFHFTHLLKLLNEAAS